MLNAEFSVDWAALAKQWMQFKDVGDSSSNVIQPPQPPPPPPPAVVPQSTPHEANISNANASSSWNSEFNGGDNASQAWEATSTSDWTADMDIQVLY